MSIYSESTSYRRTKGGRTDRRTNERETRAGNDPVRWATPRPARAQTRRAAQTRPRAQGQPRRGSALNTKLSPRGPGEPRRRTGVRTQHGQQRAPHVTRRNKREAPDANASEPQHKEKRGRALLWNNHCEQSRQMRNTEDGPKDERDNSEYEEHMRKFAS